MGYAEARGQGGGDQVSEPGGPPVIRNHSEHLALQHRNATTNQKPLLGLLPIADDPLTFDRELPELQSVSLVVAREQDVGARPLVAGQEFPEIEVGHEIAEGEQHERPLDVDSPQGADIAERCLLLVKVDRGGVREIAQAADMRPDDIAAIAGDDRDPVDVAAHEVAQQPLDHRHAGNLEHRLRHVHRGRPEPHSLATGLNQRVSETCAPMRHATLTAQNGRLTIGVLGGTSVGTPKLIRALDQARQEGRLPKMDLRLFGRARVRAERLSAYCCATMPGVGREPGDAIRLTVSTDLLATLAGCDIVLCQVRPGGMAARAGDETMALAAGVPGDEGLGPSGLANFLRSRPVLDRITEAWVEHAPSAVFLQLSSPLSLNVARAAAITGLTVLGLCELPATMSASIRSVTASRLQGRLLRHAHFGVNHWAWLYSFQDEAGIDCTDDVIEATIAADLIPVDPAVVRASRAIPLPYLSLIYHPERQLVQQCARGEPRGRQLEAWAAALDSAYHAADVAASGQVANLLGWRRMNWYEEAVVPALEALSGASGAELVANVAGVEPGIAVETPCRMNGSVITPLSQPPLPTGPAEIFRNVVAYERAALALAAEPGLDDLAQVIGLNPMVPEGACAVELARRMIERVPEIRRDSSVLVLEP